MGKQLINLTKYDIHYYLGKDKIFTLPSSGTIVFHENKEIDKIKDLQGNEVVIENIDYNSSMLLPEENDSILYVVSSVVANVLRNERNDLLTIGQLITDGNGKNIGVSSFKRISY